MKVTRHTLQELYRSDEKIAALTCYDACFATLLEESGVEILLVGDSLSNVLQGNDTTLAASMRDMIYHTRCVAKGSKHAFIITDMPFGSSQISPQHTFKNAAKLISAGCHMVKIEGGQLMADTVKFLTQRGIPVCAHIGLMPQSIHQLSGYKLQGKTIATANQLLNDATLLEKAGAGLLLLELMPASLAKKITDQISIPTIGIGAGVNCSGQVLVLHDMLGIYPTNAKCNKNFMVDVIDIKTAITNYVLEVKTRQFPNPKHEF